MTTIIAVMEYIEEHGEVTNADLFHLGYSKDYIRQALIFMTEDGYITRKRQIQMGNAFLYTFKRSFQPDEIKRTFDHTDEMQLFFHGFVRASLENR